MGITTAGIVGDAQNAVDMERGGDLAAMFKTLLSDPALVHKQGEQARKYAIRHFDKKVVIQRYLAYYHRVAADGVQGNLTANGPMK